MSSAFSKVQDYLNSRGEKDYLTIFSEVQQAITARLYELHTADVTREDMREKELAAIIQELERRSVRLAGEELSTQQLAERLYEDMEEYGVLTKPLKDETVEGININSWRDIIVDHADGETERLRGFAGPEQALNIMQRLLQASKVQFDQAIPMAEASLDSNIRITAVRSPIVTEEVAVAAYIRILRQKIFSTEEYILKGFADAREIQLIRTAAQRGVSILFVGKVNTGKTTLVKAILSGLPDDLKVVTIESGAREMNLIRKGPDGRARNKVVHMLTREDPEERRDITQEKLVVKTLRLNPDVVSVAEMRDVEAYAAQEASLSGHPVITTAHAGSIRQGHKRVAGLCRKAYPTDYQTALLNACEAFPLVCFIHMNDDGRRRIMNISECHVEDDRPIYNALWEFDVKENIRNPDGSVTIHGEHRQVGDPSASLVERMKLYGLTNEELAALKKPAPRRRKQANLNEKEEAV